MMSDVVRAPGAPRTWLFFGTLGFALLACLAMILGGSLTIAALIAVHHVPPTVQYDKLFDRADWEAAVSLGVFLGELAVIGLAVRLARRQFCEYLALEWPTREQLVFALLIMFGVLHLLGFIEPLMGETTDAGLIAEYKAARADGPLPFFLYLVNGCIGAPLLEEFMFRGFLLRGWSESFLRPTGAIALTSVLWACCHVQYDWFGVFEIFVAGLVLGYFRYRTGSTMLAVVVHSANNFYSYLLVALTT
jgi:membrane protease YdiL (CAAX protease family)